MEKHVLRFTASWCAPCKSLAKNLEGVDLGVPVSVVDIDVHSEMAVDYGIRSVPTVLLLEDRKEIKRFTGVKPTEWIKNWIQND